MDRTVGGLGLGGKWGWVCSGNTVRVHTAADKSTAMDAHNSPCTVITAPPASAIEGVDIVYLQNTDTPAEKPIAHLVRIFDLIFDSVYFSECEGFFCSDLQ
jgi:hypothetical protein